MEHKKVELVELFFDLVLVYSISKTTGLIHHLHNGIIEPWAFGSFLAAFVIVVNAWMYQTIFTSRYGSNSVRDMVFSFVSMMLLLFLSNTINSEWEITFVPFTATLGLIFAVQFVQYLLTYRRLKHSACDRFLISGFLLLTGVYAVTLFMGSLLPYSIGIWFSMVGLAINLILPIAFERRLHVVPLNFPHIVERMTLLVIITFGEMIVGIAVQFTPETTTVWSVLIFITAVGMFLHYILQFDYMADLKSPIAETFHLEYAHFPIFIGLDMMTVSFTFLMESDANIYFATVFLYAGMLLFYLGEFFARGIKKPQFRYEGMILYLQLGILAAGFALSLLCAQWNHAVVAISAVCTIALFAVAFSFYRNCRGERCEGEAYLED